jgi:E3 ubiquitin-protein ligase HUWE1
MISSPFQFVTRAVRVIDLITNIDMQGFQAHNGLASFIKRLDMEVNVCRKEQPFEIEPDSDTLEVPQPATEESASASSSSSRRPNEAFDNYGEVLNTMELSEDENMSSKAESSSKPVQQQTYTAVKNEKTCLPQRAALLKSMFNFLKKVIQDPTFSDSIRHIMEGTLPSSLKHIISNSEYYGPSLFLLATDVVTVYVFQEPSLLSTLQDNGLTGVVLHALLNKDVSI